ncbi:MarR family transcriptional regulator [archaeon]|nr:MarR family transcriptional regulator [archaeon]
MANPNRGISQKQISEATRVDKALVSRVVRELIGQGLVSRPHRARFILDQPNQLLLRWAANRNIRSNPAYFAPSKSTLKGIKHAHTLFSGAWLDSRFLKTHFTTVYVKPDFRAPLKHGKVADLKDNVILVVAPDEYVFYETRRVDGKPVVNPYQLYVDLASFGGIAQTALERMVTKYGFPKAW